MSGGWGGGVVSAEEKPTKQNPQRIEKQNVPMTNGLVFLFPIYRNTHAYVEAL